MTKYVFQSSRLYRLKTILRRELSNASDKAVNKLMCSPRSCGGWEPVDSTDDILSIVTYSSSLLENFNLPEFEKGEIESIHVDNLTQEQKDILITDGISVWSDCNETGCIRLIDGLFYVQVYED